MAFVPGVELFVGHERDQPGTRRGPLPQGQDQAQRPQGDARGQALTRSQNPLAMAKKGYGIRAPLHVRVSALPRKRGRQNPAYGLPAKDPLKGGFFGIAERWMYGGEPDYQIEVGTVLRPPRKRLYRRQIKF